MMPLQLSRDYFCSEEFLNFPIYQHSNDSESIKRSVCKKFEYIYAILKKCSDINIASHTFFRKFRQTMMRQYMRYCDIALLRFGYHKKYFDMEMDLHFMDQKFDLVTCIDNYWRYEVERFRFMIVVFFLRYICKELRLKFRKRKWDTMQPEE